MRKVVNGFTPEEQIELLKNPYTRTVSEWMIKFTDEFNELFIKRHSQGVGPSAIFRDCGYDLNILGSKRIVNYFNRLQRTYRCQNQTQQTHLWALILAQSMIMVQCHQFKHSKLCSMK